VKDVTLPNSVASRTIPSNPIRLVVAFGSNRLSFSDRSSCIGGEEVDVAGFARMSSSFESKYKLTSLVPFDLVTNSHGHLLYFWKLADPGFSLQ